MKKVGLILISCAVLALPGAAVAQNPVPNKTSKSASHDNNAQPRQAKPSPAQSPTVAPKINKQEPPEPQTKQSPSAEKPTKSESGDYPEPDWWARITNGLIALGTIALALVGGLAAIVAVLTLWTISGQTAAIRDQVQAMVKSERAWIDAEIVQPPKQLVKTPPHQLLVKNLGKTPAQLENYEIRIGPYLCDPFPESLQLAYEWNERTFIGSGESKALGPEIDLDILFDALMAQNVFDRLAFSVTVNYVDIVGGTEPRRAFVVYLYTPLLGRIERMGQFSDYK